MMTRGLYSKVIPCAGLLLCVVAASCSGSGNGSSSGGDGGPACVPGQQISCPCGGGAASGVQVCKAEGTGYEPCSCTDGGPAGGEDGGDAASDAASGDATFDARDSSVWWSDAGTCAAVANRCSSVPPTSPVVLSADMSYNDCLCGGAGNPDLAQCIGTNGSNVQARCDAYCKDNNPGFEAATSCHVEGGAFGFIVHCQCG